MENIIDQETLVLTVMVWLCLEIMQVLEGSLWNCLPKLVVLLICKAVVYINKVLMWFN